MTIAPLIPSLYYEDADAAIAFLENAFGFQALAVYRGEDGSVRHAELRYGNSVLMLSTARENPWNLSTARALGGASTVWLYLVVDDPQAHFERARANGAEILSEPSTPDYGGLEYAARDLEGNLWSFGTYSPSETPQR